MRAAVNRRDAFYLDGGGFWRRRGPGSVTIASALPVMLRMPHRVLALAMAVSVSAAALGDWPKAALVQVSGGAPTVLLDDPPNPNFLYRFERGGPCRDVVKLKNGTWRTGKALECGTLVHLYDATGIRT